MSDNNNEITVEGTVKKIKGNTPNISKQIHDKVVFTGQKIDSIIAAPLVAISKANVSMLTGQTRFLIDFCFKKIDINKNIYEPIKIKMKGTNSKGEDFIFTIPLLSLLPIGNLCVDMVKLSFDLEVTSISSHVGVVNNAADSNVIKNKSFLGVKYANKKNKDNFNHMSMEMKVKQIPLSKGLTSLLDIYSKAINTENQGE